MKRVLLAVVAAVLLLGACGDDGDSGVLRGSSDSGGSVDATKLNDDERAAAARVSSSFANDPDDFDVTPEQSECVGVRVVEQLGIERAEAIDWESDDVRVSPNDAQGIADAVMGCVDVRLALAQGFSETGDIDPPQATCLGDALHDDTIREILVGTLVDGDDYQASPAVAAPFADAMLECVDFGAAIVEQFSDDGSLSETSAQCLADGIPEDLLRDLIIGGITGEDTSTAETALAREVMRAAPDCLTDEELAGLGG